LAGKGRTVVGLNIGAPQADDGDGLIASARPASEIVAFLNSRRGEPALPPPAASGVPSLPETVSAGDTSARASAKAEGNAVAVPASVNIESNEAAQPASESIGRGDVPAPPAANVESRRDPVPLSAKEGNGDTDAASERMEAGSETTARVAALLCGPQREDREKGAILLRGLVSRRDAEPEALALFAWALRAGLLPGEDEHEAPAAAEKSAKAGNSLGKAVLGLLYRDALLLPADPRKVRALAEEAAAEGETLGISLLALSAYEDGSPDALREALRGAEKAAAAGDAAAMGLAACLYALHTEFTDYRTAEKRARAAAGYGDSLGLYILARLYKDGTVTERDPGKAWACARLSLAGESGPHREERKNLFEQLDGRLTEQEKEHGRRILHTLLRNRLPGYSNSRLKLP
jgi:hypothetical protein